MRNSELRQTYCRELNLTRRENFMRFSMNNIILEKTKAFAVRIINLYKILRYDNKEFVLSKQVLRSGTSIGANTREAMRGQSKADFYSKLNIALKEADETAYWLELLYETAFITKTQFDSIYNDCQELISLLVAITKKQYK